MTKVKMGAQLQNVSLSLSTCSTWRHNNICIQSASVHMANQEAHIFTLQSMCLFTWPTWRHIYTYKVCVCSYGQCGGIYILTKCESVHMANLEAYTYLQIMCLFRMANLGAHIYLQSMYLSTWPTWGHIYIYKVCVCRHCQPGGITIHTKCESVHMANLEAHIYIQSVSLFTWSTWRHNYTYTV